MSKAAELRSGKSHRDENFPVASHLIHPRHRAIILAFYNFVRTADDIADHATLAPADKLNLLDGLEATLLGQRDDDAAGLALRNALRVRGLPPRHAQDLLTAFRLDVSKLRYADWSELIHYCSYSAMPVGRFVLDVHGESRSTWPANDALCAALQIINHLQDCQDDYRNLDRVYLPLDALTAAGTSVEALDAGRASPTLLRCLHALAARTGALLEESRAFPVLINDTRLGLEVSVIETYAAQLVRMLQTRDPLSERVHLRKLGFLGFGLMGIMTGAVRRLARSFVSSRKPQDA